MGVKDKKPKSLLKDIFTDDEISRAKKVEPPKKNSNIKQNSIKSETIKEKKVKEKKSKDSKPKIINLSPLEKKERREHLLVIILTAKFVVCRV